MAIKQVLIATICGIGLISATSAYAKPTKAEVTVTVPPGSHINIVVKDPAATQKATSENVKKGGDNLKTGNTKGYPKTFCLKQGETLHFHLGSHSLAHKVAQNLGYKNTSEVHVGQYTVHNGNGKSSYSSSCK